MNRYETPKAELEDSATTRVAKTRQDEKFFALCLILGGCISVLVIFVIIGQNLSDLLNLVVLVPMGGWAVWHVVKGIDLWQDKESGIHWAKILFAAQIPIISSNLLVYGAHTGIGVNVTMGSGGFTFNTLFGGSFTVLLFSPQAASAVGINLFAVFAFAYLMLKYPAKPPATEPDDTSTASTES